MQIESYSQQICALAPHPKGSKVSEHLSITLEMTSIQISAYPVATKIRTGEFRLATRAKRDRPNESARILTFTEIPA